MVVDVIKTAFDVPFHKPFRPCEGSFYLTQTGVTAAVWPEPVGMFGKIGFIDSLQQYPYNLLHDLVVG